MAIEKASNCVGKRSSSEKDYFTALAFLGLGDILYEIAVGLEKCGDIRSLDDKGENVDDNFENHKPSALAILLKAALGK